VNGVLRGNTIGPANRARSGFRRNDYRSKGDSLMGFRLNGVLRGGYFDGIGRYARGGFRTSGYALSTVYVRLGFRSEWCSSRWGI